MYTYTSTKKKEWKFWFITWTWYKHHVQISEYLRTRPVGPARVSSERLLGRRFSRSLI